MRECETQRREHGRLFLRLHPIDASPRPLPRTPHNTPFIAAPIDTPQNETEAARLQAILDGFATTEEDDLAAAQSECGAEGGLVRCCHTHAPDCAHTPRSLRRTRPTSTELHRAKDWRKAMIMQFRATRKRALRLAIARFSGKAPLEGGHSEL